MGISASELTARKITYMFDLYIKYSYIAGLELTICLSRICHLRTIKQMLFF